MGNLIFALNNHLLIKTHLQGLTLLIGIQSWILFIVLLTIFCKLKLIETDQNVPLKRTHFLFEENIQSIEKKSEEFGKIRPHLRVTGVCWKVYSTLSQNI